MGLRSDDPGKGAHAPKRNAFDVMCAPAHKQRNLGQPQKQGWIELGKSCTIGYFPRHLDKAASDASFQELLRSAPWQESEITVYGATVVQPRRLCYMSDDTSLQYSYSGAQDIKVQPWHPAVIPLKEMAEDLVGKKFNSCLLNLYRNGKDYVGWHSDDEKLYGKDAPICSVSLGQTRDFQLRLKQDRTHKLEYSLGHGDVFVMKGALQTHWQHQVPKRTTVMHPRINLTFRIANLPKSGACASR
eukprot:jgi/Ulvmu1/263/UM001_0267.1